MRKKVIYAFCLLVLSCVACSNNKGDTLRLATTTSVNDTGLLDILSAKLAKEQGIELQWVSVGTGKALALGKNCDVDVVLTHAPQSEKEAIKSGDFRERIPLMKNYFIIVGPSVYKDELGDSSAQEILSAIAEKKYKFISRGDDSGTHKKEKELWASMNTPSEAIDPSWYIESGQGMLQSLLIAEEKQGFILTDSATWYKFKEVYPKTDLIAYTTDDEALVNIYSTLFLNKEKCSKVKDDLARRFVAWLTSQPVQQFIAAYTLHNQRIFFPLYQEGMPK